MTVAASLDGVMPMKDGKRQEKRERVLLMANVPEGQQVVRRPVVETLSFYDDQGDRLSTIRMGRMPESKKATLKKSLSNLLDKVLQQKPNLTLVKVADGARTIGHTSPKSYRREKKLLIITMRQNT
ncbi:hypothetical protein [Endozoicomonas sp. SCSIO W0465]|uniref:hypothetical protein n=1 Tax=Endozoicomonas sp. SCSIO W0465 TaxID=2918516 RepID=UPI002075CD29|nr:hypothetical protein [Endozoicomonas sp. SCSIO W0465]USE38985.1 hypothetical protein MJO57_12965 [Endozoicomonas sp. SCSIO W0465]